MGKSWRYSSSPIYQYAVMSHAANDKNGGNGDKPNHLALWAALYAFFANIVALKVMGVIFSDENIRIGLGALFTSIAVAGSVYAKQRLDEAKYEREKREKDVS